MNREFKAFGKPNISTRIFSSMEDKVKEAKAKQEQEKNVAPAADSAPVEAEHVEPVVTEAPLDVQGESKSASVSGAQEVPKSPQKKAAIKKQPTESTKKKSVAKSAMSAESNGKVVKSEKSASVGAASKKRKAPVSAAAATADEGNDAVVAAAADDANGEQQGEPVKKQRKRSNTRVALANVKKLQREGDPEKIIALQPFKRHVKERELALRDPDDETNYHFSSDAIKELKAIYTEDQLNTCVAASVAMGYRGTKKLTPQDINFATLITEPRLWNKMSKEERDSITQSIHKRTHIVVE